MEDVARPGRLVLIGHPVAHSLSPAMQNAALQAAGLSLDYEALNVPPGQLEIVARLLTEANAAGNVTVPYKEEFFALCMRSSPVAARVGAVNTFWTEDGELVGDNTDVGGFERAVELTFGPPADHSRVAVLGAGGAAAAVLAAVERWEGATATIISRSHERGRALAARFPDIAVAAEDLARGLEHATLVVNATPVGLHGDALPLDPAAIATHTDAFDLAYRRGETPWVIACRARGLRAADGREMLVEQGALAFERWFGLPADRHVMRRALA